MKQLKILLVFVLAFIITQIDAQSINAGAPVFEEALRRKQLLGEFDSNVSFQVRPIKINLLNEGDFYYDLDFFLSGPNAEISSATDHTGFSLLPLRSTLAYNSGRPYGWGNSLMIPNVGLQSYLTAGASYESKRISVQFQPEFLWAQNKEYDGYPASFNNDVHRARFFYWN